ncbi:hypothetical protein L345_12342, partial [Ophiophagus hannah]
MKKYPCNYRKSPQNLSGLDNRMCFGIFIVQRQKDVKHVNTQVKLKPFMIIVLQEAFQAQNGASRVVHEAFQAQNGASEVLHEASQAPNGTSGVVLLTVDPQSSLTQWSMSAAAAPSPVLGNIPPGDGMPVGPVPPGFFQPFMSPRYPGGPRPPLRIPNQALGGVPGSQPLLPSGMDPTRQQ